jgi:hypothetical protein
VINAGLQAVRYLFYNGDMKSGLIVLTNRDNYRSRVFPTI